MNHGQSAYYSRHARTGKQEISFHRVGAKSFSCSVHDEDQAKELKRLWEDGQSQAVILKHLALWRCR